MNLCTETGAWRSQKPLHRKDRKIWWRLRRLCQGNQWWDRWSHARRYRACARNVCEQQPKGNMS